MKYLIFLTTCCFLLLSCANTPASDSKPEQTPAPTATASSAIPPADSMICVSGLLQCRDSIALLIETDHDTVVAQYRLIDKTGTLIARHNAICGTTTNFVEMTRAAVCGVNMNPGKKSRIYTMEVFKVDSVVAKTAENFGLPFEFWCLGSEGDWRLEISNYIGGIYYEHNGNKTAWFCAWLPPTIGKNKWTYEIPAAPGNYGALSLVVKKEKYTDPKTKRVFDYACELKVGGGQPMKGGAIKGNADPLGPLELRQH